MAPLSALLNLLSQIPSVGKYLLILLIALNAHSLPLVWHFRFWWRLGPRYLLVWTRGRQAYIDKCQKRIRATGGITARTVSKRRAWFDDCDYNMHLSNSCYAKTADISMSSWMWDALPIFFEAGGYSALGGTHYTFIREIPILSEYTIESRVVGWGEKWYYLVTEFIIRPKKSSKKVRAKTADSQTPGAVTPAPPAQTDSPSSGSTTPTELVLPGTDTTDPAKRSASPSSPPSSDLAAEALAALRSPRPRADGGVIAGIAVHELCFKIGRITVPPRIALYLAGHSASPAARAASFKLGSNKRAAAAWVAGGWKAEPNAAEIGRDILPAVAGSKPTAAEKKFGLMADAERLRLVSAQIETAVKGMEGVSVGLGETVRL